jgi:hypothetical protein
VPWGWGMGRWAMTGVGGDLWDDLSGQAVTASLGRHQAELASSAGGIWALGRESCRRSRLGHGRGHAGSLQVWGRLGTVSRALDLTRALAVSHTCPLGAATPIPSGHGL